MMSVPLHETNEGKAWLATIEAYNAILEALGVDTTSEALRDTPLRATRALREMTRGYADDPRQILSRTFEAADYDEMIVVRDINFVSLCEHHLLPFVGVAHVGYVPAQINPLPSRAETATKYRVVGLSKIARLVECYARRLQIQERMTRQIADALVEHVGVRGSGVIVKATHSCMALRGVEKHGTMITSALTGVLRENDAARAEFLRLVS